MRRNVYLDYSATTPVDERVLDAMMPYFREIYGNTTSLHAFGRKAEQAIEDAREAVASILNCKPNEIVFTSGGSESDNLAIRGAGWSAREQGKKGHLITTPVEHHAVGNTINQMAELMGFEQTVLPVDKQAMIDVEDFANAITDETVLASIIYVNNEVGTISPLQQIAEHTKNRQVLLHTDAVQASGQLTLDVQQLGVDMLSISAHKFYGPKGVGALYIREGIELASSQTGGSHESGRRAGTSNTHGIVGMAKALQIAYDDLDVTTEKYRKLRGHLVDGVLSQVSDVVFTGHPEQRLPSHASFLFAGVDSSQLVMHLDMKGVAVSGGSACKTGNPEPSDVMLAMGYTPEEAMGTLRLTVGRFTTLEEIDYAINAVAHTVEKLRKLASELLS